MSDVSEFGVREVTQRRCLAVSSGAGEVEIISDSGRICHLHRLTEDEALALAADIQRRVAAMRKARGA